MTSERLTKEPLSQRGRTAILEAAEELFARSGINGVTVRDIAEHAGVNISAVSYHFDGKEGLYRACVERYGKARLRVVRPLLTAARSRGEFEVKVRLLIESALDFAADNRDLLALVMREMELGMPVARDIMEETVVPIYFEFSTFFTQAQKDGFLAQDLDPLLAAHVIQGTITQLSRIDPVRHHYIHVTIADPIYRAHTIETLTKIALHGMLSR